MAEGIVSTILDQLASIKEKGVRIGLGAGKEIQKLTENLEDIRAVLDDAERRQVVDSNVGDWLNKLKDIAYDIDDMLDEWKASILRDVKKVCYSTPSCKQVVLCCDIAFKLKRMNRSLNVIADEGKHFEFKSMKRTGVEQIVTSPVIDPSEVHGRDQDKKQIVHLLVSGSSQGPTLPIISIIGREGIGKTTLAQLVYSDHEVDAYFHEKIWISVSYPLDEMRIAKTVLKSLKANVTNPVELETVLGQLRQAIKGKKFLLVLDDLRIQDPKCWDSNKWEQLMYSLKSGSEGSRVLITTCEMNLADVIGTAYPIPLSTLSEEDSWSLFSQVAFYERKKQEKLEYIGKKIVRKCAGLPLAVKILGSFLRFKRNIDEWESVLSSDIWGLKEVETRHFLAPLLLSYYDLPSTLRKCFSYCAMFPRNYEIEKDRLIKLWMAQSYLGDDQIGLEYFDFLAQRAFFQDFQKDEYDGSIVRCKMHDVVHDFAQFLTKNECSIIEVDDEKCQIKLPRQKVRHLMTVIERDCNPFSTSVCTDEMLRSVVVESRGSFMVDMDLSKLFGQSTSLRTLDLSNRDNVWCNFLKKVPRGIKKLIHLRYLNLSKNTKIKELPETLCDLFNLQTLELNACTNLRKLPHGMAKLVNLRHLVNKETISLSYIPKGIEKLTHLLTLSEFVVSGAGNGGRASTLECLKNLDNIGGSLKIKMLGNVKDAREVPRAVLWFKENLLELCLSFEKSEEEGRMIEKDDLLEPIQPHQNLQRLEIFDYRGYSMPSWTFSLANLKFMSLNRFINFKRLPPLGKLPSLESLVIRSMKSVKQVGHEFLGLDLIDRTEELVAFPKLKSLELQKMRELEEWNYEIIQRDDSIKIMPCLHSLTIGTCRKLKALPDHLLRTNTLKELNIISCDALNTCYRSSQQGADWPQISHIPNVKIYHDRSLVYAKRNNHCISVDPQIDAVKQVQHEDSIPLHLSTTDSNEIS